MKRQRFGTFETCFLAFCRCTHARKVPEPARPFNQKRSAGEPGGAPDATSEVSDAASELPDSASGVSDAASGSPDVVSGAPDGVSDVSDAASELPPSVAGPRTSASEVPDGASGSSDSASGTSDTASGAPPVVSELPPCPSGPRTLCPNFWHARPDLGRPVRTSGRAVRARDAVSEPRPHWNFLGEGASHPPSSWSLSLRNPPVDVRLEHVERDGARSEDGVVEGADVEVRP